MRRLAVLFVLAAAMPARPARAQSQPERAAFVVRLGTDTLSVERFTRSATRLEGEVVTRSPRTMLRRFAADLGPTGGVTRFEAASARIGAPAIAAPLQRLTAVVGGDSIRIEMRRGDSIQTVAVAADARTIPLLGGAYAPYEILTTALRRLGLDSLAVPTYPLGGRATAGVTLTRLGPDSVLLATPITPFRVRLDRDGRILGLHAPGSTQQVVLTRVPWADVAAIAAAWAARDAQGQAMGTLSPRDTVRATTAGASLLVDYGRPAKRGREIFGNVVPWGTVWRTGANAATQLRTDRDLVIGGVVVPAGTYTLWTLPALTGWQLIVNRQTGQWGTAYDPGQDFIRVPLVVTVLAQPVELFTIAIDPQGAGGVISLAWDRTRAQLPFTVR
jgi:hypothetical protein